MAKTKSKRRRHTPLGEVQASARRLKVDGERLVTRMRRDAQALVRHGRAEVLKDVQAIRKDLERRATSTVRGLERSVLKQLHAATEERVRRVERRVAALERALAALSRPRAA